MLKWLKEFISKIINAMNPNSSKENNSNNSNGNNDNNKQPLNKNTPNDFYECELITQNTDGVSCFSMEYEGAYTFFLPIENNHDTLPDLITILYSLDNPLDGPIYEELVPLDCPGRTCVITQLTMGKTMPSDDKDGQYWYMMSAYNPRYEVIANYRGTIDCGNPDYPTMFKMGDKKVIKFTPQDYWLTEEMEKAGYSISLPVSITEDVNFCAYLYFRG